MDDLLGSSSLHEERTTDGRYEKWHERTLMYGFSLKRLLMKPTTTNEIV
jgi:hypothetical protein